MVHHFLPWSSPWVFSQSKLRCKKCPFIHKGGVVAKSGCGHVRSRKKDECYANSIEQKSPAGLSTAERASNYRGGRDSGPGSAVEADFGTRRFFETVDQCAPIRCAARRTIWSLDPDGLRRGARRLLR